MDAGGASHTLGPRPRRTRSERQLRDRSARLGPDAGRESGDACGRRDSRRRAADTLRGRNRGRRHAVRISGPNARCPRRAPSRLAPFQQRLFRGRRGGDSVHALGLIQHDQMNRFKTGAVWLIGHASRFVPIVVLGVVVALTSQTLRQVHPRDIAAALRTMSWAWLLIAAAVTVINVGVMGLYDVVAFRHTRTRAMERWRYGAVAFAWSNFLTLGPFAGPAIRFWLYRDSVEHSADLETGVLSITIAFASGLIGWTLATIAVPAASTLANAVVLTLVAGGLVYACVCLGRFAAVRFERFDEIDPRPIAALVPALVGWLDWLLAGLVFLACLHSTGTTIADVASIRSFFLGQAIGLASLVPGGFGSSDAFWIAHVPLPGSFTAAALVAYRLVYYVVPWAAASLVLLSWATRRTSRRVEMARRMLAGLVAAGGALMSLSTASPGLSPRLDLLEQVV